MIQYTLRSINKKDFLSLFNDANQSDEYSISDMFKDLRQRLVDNKHHLTCLYVNELKAFVTFNKCSIYEPVGGIKGCNDIVESGFVKDSYVFAFRLDGTLLRFKWH